MIKTTVLGPAVLKVLATIEWDGDAAKITAGQLDRKLYLAVNDALEAVGGKWSRKAKAHLFEGNQRDALEALIETGAFIRGLDLKQHFGEFETPEELADQLIGLARITDKDIVLEPSAGGGNLLKALAKVAGPLIDAVEVQGKHHAALTKLADAVHVRDFLELTLAYFTPSGPFTRIIMNPPFARQTDVDHVLHAWKFLGTGGRLVAIMSPGWTFRSNRKSLEFHKFVEDHGEWFNNPPGSFAVSGTNVNTVMLVLEK